MPTLSERFTQYKQDLSNAIGALVFDDVQPVDSSEFPEQIREIGKDALREKQGKIIAFWTIDHLSYPEISRVSSDGVILRLKPQFHLVTAYHSTIADVHDRLIAMHETIAGLKGPHFDGKSLKCVSVSGDTKANVEAWKTSFSVTF